MKRVAHKFILIATIFLMSSLAVASVPISTLAQAECAESSVEPNYFSVKYRIKK